MDGLTASLYVLYMFLYSSSTQLIYLQVTGNDISGVNKPVPSYATDNQCTGPVRALFESSAILNYYPSGIRGAKDLQSDFVSSSGNGTNFICAGPK
jgi:hypothetical protein